MALRDSLFPSVMWMRSVKSYHGFTITRRRRWRWAIALASALRASLNRIIVSDSLIALMISGKYHSASKGSMKGSETKLGHRPSLDGLRGISILAVMAFHAGSWVVKGGHLGVDMFFVLSGFLITFLLLQECDNTGSISLKHFYVRRALRLLPALITVLMVCGICAAVFTANDSSTFTYRGILYTLLYSSNLYQAF